MNDIQLLKEFRTTQQVLSIKSSDTSDKHSKFFWHVDMIIPFSMLLICRKSSNLFVWIFILGRTSCVSAKDFGSGGYVLRRLRYMAFAVLLRSFGSSCVSSYSCRAFRISLDGLWLMSSDALRFTEFLSTCRSFFLSSGSWLCSFFCFQSSFTPFHCASPRNCIRFQDIIQSISVSITNNTTMAFIRVNFCYFHTVRNTKTNWKIYSHLLTTRCTCSS